MASDVRPVRRDLLGRGRYVGDGKRPFNVEYLALMQHLGMTPRTIWSLVRKPGGFARYVYREEMFPQPVFRAAYDAIQAA